jgi:hypothetical protein
MSAALKSLLVAEFLLAFLIPTIGLIVLLGAAPATVVMLFAFAADTWFLLTGIGWLLLTVAAVYGLWGAWQLLAIQLFPSMTIRRPRALTICLLVGLVALSVAVVLARHESWFVLAGLLLPVPVTIHLLALYGRSSQLRHASDV